MDSPAQKRERSLFQCQWGGLVDTLLEQYGESVAVEELVKIEPTLVERLQALEGCKSLYEVIKVFQKYDWPSMEPNADSWVNRINSRLLDQLLKAFLVAKHIGNGMFSYGVNNGSPFHYRHAQYLCMMKQIIAGNSMEAFEFLLEGRGLDLNEYSYDIDFGHSCPQMLARIWTVTPLTLNRSKDIVLRTTSCQVLDMILESKMLSLKEINELILRYRAYLHNVPHIAKWVLDHGEPMTSLTQRFASVQENLKLLQGLHALGVNAHPFVSFVARQALASSEWKSILFELKKLSIPLVPIAVTPTSLDMYKCLVKLGYRATGKEFRAAFDCLDVAYVQALLHDKAPIPADALYETIIVRSHGRRHAKGLSEFRDKKSIVRLLMQHGCTITQSQFESIRNQYAGLARAVQGVIKD